MGITIKTLLTIIISIIFTNLCGQDLYFSQFFANRLYLNPAWAGVDECRKLSLNYRNQWPTADNSYVTYSASYDQYVEPLHGGIGISVFNDNQGKGVLTEFGISAIYSYHLYFSRTTTINAGFQVGYVQRRLNTNNFIYGDMLNPDGTILPQGSENYGVYSTEYPDFAFGMTGFHKNFYTGISMYHLFNPLPSFSTSPETRLARKFIFFAGGIIPVYEKRLGKEVVRVSPNIIYIQQKNFNQLSYGFEALYKDAYVGGIWLRQNLGINFSSLVFSGGLTIDKFRVRYSYDCRLSHPSIALPPDGSHELSLILTMDSEKKKIQRTIKCPKF